MAELTNKRLLVVAGEASGDLAASQVLSALSEAGARPQVTAVGGASVLPHAARSLADLRDFSAMGVAEVAPGARAVLAAFARTSRVLRRHEIDAALLVGFSEFNSRLVPALARAGVPAVVYGAPQVWAWRAGRMKAFRALGDGGKLCVMLPFEEALWRNAGVDATYVGHPAARALQALAHLPRSVIRGSLGLTPTASAVAILPGSRNHEVRALLEPLLAAYQRVRHHRASLDARVLLAPSLDAETAAFAIAACRAARAPHVMVSPDTGAMPLLPAFDVALSASGTASLEAALAGTIPIVAYKVGVLTELAARALVRVEHVALPNIVLGRRVFAEHLQRDVEPKTLARSVHEALERRDELRAACDLVRARVGDKDAPREVAGFVRGALSR